MSRADLQLGENGSGPGCVSRMELQLRKIGRGPVAYGGWTCNCDIIRGVVGLATRKKLSWIPVVCQQLQLGKARRPNYFLVVELQVGQTWLAPRCVSRVGLQLGKKWADPSPPVTYRGWNLVVSRLRGLSSCGLLPWLAG